MTDGLDALRVILVDDFASDARYTTLASTPVGTAALIPLLNRTAARVRVRRGRG